MRQSIVILCIFIMQSCHVTSLNKKDKNSLYLNTTIPAYSSLEVFTENNKSFSFDAVNKSKSKVVFLVDSQSVAMEEGRDYTANANDKQKVKFINSSGDNSAINLRIYNHSSKVVTTVAKL